MSRRIVVASFAREEDLLRAVGGARAAGLEVLDARTPYPVHGLDDALGLRPSRLPWVCLAFGVLGLVLGTLLQVWTSAVDWPLNVGGRPLASYPAFVPVTFELVILFAGVATVAAFLVRSRLRPSRVPELPAPGVTDDRFVLLLGANDATYRADEVARTLGERHRATRVDEVLVEDRR